MKLQPVTYRGRLAAVCSPHRVYFAEWIEILELDHPVRRFVGAMCLYAGEVLNGSAAASYSDDDARRRARARLIPLTDLFTGLAATDAELAEYLNVPLDEIRVAHDRVRPPNQTLRLRQVPPCRRSA